MYRIELYLNDYDRVRLDEIRFYPATNSPPRITTCSGSPSYCVGTSKNFFIWSSAVRAMTLLLLKAADPTVSNPCISGGARSPASSLDYALSKEPAWIIDFFGVTGSGRAVAKLLLGRRNTERKRPGPVEVYTNDAVLKREDLLVYHNGKIATVDAIQKLAVQLESNFSNELDRRQPPPAGKSAFSSPLDERESSPFALTSRTVRLFLDVNTRRLTFTLTTTQLNITNEPISFLQHSIYNAHGRPIVNVEITSKDDPGLRWNEVAVDEHQIRMLVTFSKPILPGEERTVTLKYEAEEVHDSDGHVNHFLRFPCQELHLEAACSPSHRIYRSEIFAERDDVFLYGNLPEPKPCDDGTGNNCVRWSMKNPPHGYQYRLLWAIEAQVSMPVNPRLSYRSTTSRPDVSSKA